MEVLFFHEMKTKQKQKSLSLHFTMVETKLFLHRIFPLGHLSIMGQGLGDRGEYCAPDPPHYCLIS